MYCCIKCKKDTETSDVQNIVSKNGRNMKRGKCVVCGKIKTQFVRQKVEDVSSPTPSGGSILNKVLNNLLKLTLSKALEASSARLYRL